MSAEWTWSIEATIPSDPAEARQLLDELLTKLAEHGWDEEHRFGIHLAVEEALMNAIKHGNQRDRDKQVIVEYRLSETALRIEVEDEGSGFDPGCVPDPTLDENLELPSGRGLMLMRQFMTQVEFNARGNRVVMLKDRTAALE